MKNKKSIWNKISCVVLTVVTIFTANPMPTQAEIYWPQAPQVTSPDAIVIEVNSGAVLYEKNCDTVRYPASITKVLTTLLALENCALDEVVTFSADAVFKNEGDTSHIARDLDEQMTMEECLYGVMLESANECAYAVAEHVGAKLGGDYRTFIDLMNQRAKELGCTNTHFNNANGLPDTEHWTSARDMALISAEAYRNETFRIITGTKAYQIPPTNKHVDITYLNNHHQMLHYYKTSKYLYEYCTGGKTGYTQAAGSTLVTFAEKDGMALVCVVMNTTGQDQYLDTTALFEYCFQNFKSYNIAEHKEYITAHEKSKGVMNNQSSYVTLDESATVVLPVSASFSDAQFSITEQENKGDIVATLSYMYADRMVGSVEIVPAQVHLIESYFDKQVAVEEEPTQNVVKVKPAFLIAICIAFAVLIFLLCSVKRLYDNYYMIRHDFEVKRERRNRFRPVEKRRRRRKKGDSMFR